MIISVLIMISVGVVMFDVMIDRSGEKNVVSKKRIFVIIVVNFEWVFVVIFEFDLM